MQRSSAFHPLNEDHAIESVKFSVILNSGIHPPSILAVERAHGVWKDTLPAISVADVDLDIGGRQGKAPGVLFAFVKPDASPTWSMHIAGNRIDVECFLYSRWQRVWGTAREYFIKVLEVLYQNQSMLMVSAAELTVKDVFLGPSEYSLDLLIRRSELVPDMLFKAGRVWHNHSGWLEDEHENIRTVNNLNLQAIPLDDDTSVSIFHYQMLNTGVDLSIDKVLANDFAKIDGMMGRLHDANKTLIKKVVTTEICQRIGL